MSFAHSVIRIDRKSAYVAQTVFRPWGFAVLGVSALLYATAALAADVGNLSDAKATYQKERATCISGRSNQDRATCLREAGAAFNEAKRGRRNDGQAQPQYEQNALIRCNALPQEDRQACERRMKGEGVSKGSAAEGGIYREIATPEATPQGSPMLDSNGVSPDDNSQGANPK